MLKDRICTFIDCQIEAYSKTWATVKVKERQRYLEADSADSPFRV